MTEPFVDKRGPSRRIVDVIERPEETLLLMDCGHVARIPMDKGRKWYRIGGQRFCLGCGPLQYDKTIYTRAELKVMT